MFDTYPVVIEVPEFIILENLTVDQHETLIDALVQGPTQAKAARDLFGISIPEGNRIVTFYNQMQRRVQQGVVSNPTVTVVQAIDVLVGQFSVEEGVASALIAALELRNARGDDWEALKAAIIDTIEPNGE